MDSQTRAEVAPAIPVCERRTPWRSAASCIGPTAEHRGSVLPVGVTELYPFRSSPPSAQVPVR
jgi:hypothetical protein